MIRQLLYLQLESLTQSELASRLTLNCSPCYVQPEYLANLPITVMDVWDESALSSQVREDLYKSYPHAKRAHLKSGGNFPYLSRSDEVNLHLLVSIPKLSHLFDVLVVYLHIMYNMSHFRHNWSFEILQNGD